jgi:mannose-6-phosphate isomerase-like protein (cupin superfamily)
MGSHAEGPGNAARGHAVFVDVNNSYVATDKALVALLGVDDLVVVASEDAILVTQRARVSDMKQLVEQLKDTPSAVTIDHLKVHRPWGSYQSIDRGDRHQVKRIVVKPGRRLSLPAPPPSRRTLGGGARRDRHRRRQRSKPCTRIKAPISRSTRGTASRTRARSTSN